MFISQWQLDIFDVGRVVVVTDWFFEPQDDFRRQRLQKNP